MLSPYTIPNSKVQKNGKFWMKSAKSYKWFASPMRTIHVTREGDYQQIKYEHFNPGSRSHIIQWMKEDHGYEFPTFTAAGSPKADVDSLEGLDIKEGKLLKRYLKVVKDQSQLGGKGGWLNYYNENTHSIHHRVDLLGATTHRATHSKPNLGQVPADHDFRSIFTAPEGRVMVGADLKNIEIRVLAHYLSKYDGGKYAEAVLSKDMHFYHAKLSGFWTEDDRDWPDDAHSDERTPEMIRARTLSKAFFFAWLYAAGDTVRGNDLWYDGCLGEYTKKEYTTALKKVERRVVVINEVKYFPIKKDKLVVYDEKLVLKTIFGKRVSDTFLEKVEGIKDLIKDCQQQSKNKGTVTAIDGRELKSRSQHSALNLLLQGSAGIIAKKWMVNYHELARKEGLPHLVRWSQSAFVHDEYQCACEKDYAKTLGSIMVRGCAMIQQQYNTALPIEADFIIGANWAQTH